MPNRRSLFALAIAVLVLCAGLGARTPAQQGGAPPPQTGTGFITGRVTEGNTTRPVPGAIVALFGGSGGGPARMVGTDEQGRFYFAGLPPGSFQINATRPGYLQMAAFLPRPLVLAAGERRSDVLLKLVKQGALSGIVRDDAGDVVVGTDVMAFRRALTNGAWTLRRTGQARTDDRGAYRIAGVDPGEYLICACARDPIPFDGVLLTTIASEPLQLMTVAARALSRGADVAELDTTLRTYAPMFFGNSSTIAQASRVRIDSGDEKAGLDITTPVVPATRVSGRVVGGMVSAANLMLIPAGNARAEGAIAAIPPMLVQADGRFDFAGVPPGQYVVRVVPRSTNRGGMSGAALAFLGSRAADVARPAEPANAQAPAPVFWAEQPIVVGPQGARDIVVALRPTISVSGRVIYEQDTRTEKISMGFSIIPSPPDLTRAQGTQTRSNIDGTFTMTGLMPGRYVVVMNPVPAYYIRSITIGGADVTDLPIEIGEADVADLTVTFRPGTMGGIDGAVAGMTPAPTELLTALVFPVDRKYWAEPSAARRLFRTSDVNADGKFAANSFPAGEYFVCVVRDDSATDWLDPARIEVFSRSAQRVVVSDGRRATVMVPR